MPLLRGAVPSPRHTLAAAIPFRAAPYPASYLVFPKKLSMWGNSQYGDCVSAEEAFGKAAWSTKLGLPETFITEQTVIQWARQHRYLNGAELVPVMQSMAAQGMQADDGHVYTDGSPLAVDYMNDDALFSAIYEGAAVKIGCAANQLEHAVNSTNGRSGWVGYGWQHDGNEDHCTALCGFAKQTSDLVGLFAQNGITVSLPSGFSPNAPSVAFYTWNSIGLVELASVRKIMGEAWIRRPTTPEQVAPPDPPQPPNPPNPPDPPQPPIPGGPDVEIYTGTRRIIAPGYTLG